LPSSVPGTCFLCAWKWLGQDVVNVRGLCDYPLYSTDKSNDKSLLVDLWDVFNDADIVIAHNGDAFDIKKSNARFVIHDMPQPSPYKTVDTLKIARKHFKFESNKLNDLGSYLQVGNKTTHTGWSLWKGCMDGDLDAWEKMKEYNAQDVLLLESIYLKLRPWSTSHPDLNLYSHAEACPTCQSQKVQRRGFSYAKTQVRQRFHCQDCGSWFSGKIVKK
jgi:uncharacterized protein YprB with RNaseH-like and TPR domain